MSLASIPAIRILVAAHLSCFYLHSYRSLAQRTIKNIVPISTDLVRLYYFCVVFYQI
ncbi:hypothetical protein JCM15548_11092 [Geofilum rubicundum JCM 15548]|uniref:Uncharacterized protein n=1 Tax=Geofilum rubicundum JCM 15548 TaxID=1236989 RepID=A0A0E9LVR7_9BACT|nr:hypothetical protein JCM15548_11092 [Geofilum rubicundum JCM 15548]